MARSTGEISDGGAGINPQILVQRGNTAFTLVNIEELLRGRRCRHENPHTNALFVCPNPHNRVV